MKDKDDKELVIECSRANAQVVFDEPDSEEEIRKPIDFQEKYFDPYIRME